MKRMTLLLIASALFFGCQKHDSSSPEEKVLSHRECATNEAVQLAIANDPSVGQRMEQVEAFVKRAISNNEVQRTAGSDIVIPVVVHVLYHTAAENISDAQVQSQIDVLNEDFNLRNADRNDVPSLFSGVTADVGIKFVLAQTVRKYTSRTGWPANDNMKFDQK